MENKKHSQGFLRQRKLLTVLPLLVLPFLTLGFWALGGGQSQTLGKETNKGFNSELPGVHLKNDKPLDKMSYYDQAKADSAKLKELKKNDPYYTDSSGPDTMVQGNTLLQDPSNETGTYYDSSSRPAGNRQQYNNANERKVYQKLEQLNSALSQEPELTSDDPGDPRSKYATERSGLPSGEIDRLEQMMRTMSQPAQDPEMEQINGMLERILDVQNPARVQEKLRQVSEERRGRVFAVSQGKNPHSVTSLDMTTYNSDLRQRLLNLGGQQNGFYSFENLAPDSASQNAIEAVVHEDQSVVNGSTIKLRLATDIFINGVLIPKESFIYGTASLNGERLNVKIAGVRYRNNLFPVELAVFDMDGLDGIYIPGAISRDVAKESTERGLQNIGLTSLDPSIGMQAAGVGVEAAKTLFSKKVKLIRVTVKAGYRVLLRDEKQKQQD